MLEACFKDVITISYQAMTPYVDPSYDEVDIYGKGNNDNDLLQDFGEDGMDNAYAQPSPYVNMESGPSNNNPKKRKDKGKLRNKLVKYISFNIPLTSYLMN